MFGGGLVARRSSRFVSTQKVFIQVRAAEMRNTLVLLYLVIWVFLSFELATVCAFCSKV